MISYIVKYKQMIKDGAFLCNPLWEYLYSPLYSACNAKLGVWTQIHI